MNLSTQQQETKVESNVFHSELDADELNDVNDLYAGRLSVNSRKAYENDMKCLMDFCSIRFPAVTMDDITDVHLCAYFRHQLKMNLSIRTITRHYHGFRKHSFKRTITPETWLKISGLLSGIKRTGKAKITAVQEGTTRKPHKPLLLADVITLIEHSESVRNKALISMLFFTACRRSEISNLLWSDITIVGDKGMIVSIRQSKTDQEGKGVQIALDYRSESESHYCPCRLLTQWKELQAETKPSESVFGIKDYRIYEVVNRLLEDAGYDSSEYGVHSTRSGAATSAIQANIPIEKVSKLLHHKLITTTMLYYKQDDLFSDANRKGRL
jgi:integrase